MRMQTYRQTRLRSLLIFLFAVCYLKILAQPQVFPGITLRKIQSLVLDESRDLMIYQPSTKTHSLPLVIVFDGEGLFEPVVSAVRFMHHFSEMPQMPEALVVGIPNTYRSRDMPIPQHYGKKKGEENFEIFIEKELLPWLGKEYLLNGHIILVGQSQGALFSSYLMARNPSRFPWVISIDGPMGVDPATSWIKDKIRTLAGKPGSRIRYVSQEVVFGWSDEWISDVAGSARVSRTKYLDETHESVAYKSIYDGLKFLYSDFSPQRKDLSYPDLYLYYNNLSTTYGFPYESPLKTMLVSASRKISENRKEEVMQLLRFAEEKYGPGERLDALRISAAKITGNPDTLIDRYLKNSPTPEQVKKIAGKWSGKVDDKEGTELHLDVEFLVEDGKAVVREASIINNYKMERLPLFHIREDGAILFGIKNRGSGWVVWIFRMDGPDAMVGRNEWLGYSIRPDAPPEIKKRIQWIIDNPPECRLVRQH